MFLKAVHAMFIFLFFFFFLLHDYEGMLNEVLVFVTNVKTIL